MVLSRLESKLQKYYPQLGVELRELLATLVSLAKGNTHGHKWLWFHYLFTGPSYKLRAGSLQEAIEMLRHADWVEEDDLIQELMIVVFRKNITKNDYVARQQLGMRLRDYLTYTERVYRRFCDWSHRLLDDGEPGYCEIPEADIDGRILFGKHPFRNYNLSLFDRYIIYLYFVLGLDEKEIGRVLLVDRRQFWRYWQSFKQRIKDKKNEFDVP